MSDDKLIPVTIHLTSHQWDYLYKESKTLGLHSETYFPVSLMAQRIIAEAIKTAKDAQE